MNLIGDPGTTELGYLLLLAGVLLLAIVFAVQTALLSRRLRQREALGRQMEELAYFDPLTQLPNRRLLSDRLQRALYAAERQQSNAAVYFIDLDDFKSINDRFGHAVGDQVLAGLARVWSEELRAIDTLARWGGDEFVVVTDGIASAADIHSVVERLQRAISVPLEVMGHAVTVRMSLGVAVGCEGQELPAKLIQCADSAMYRAKRSGEGHDYEVVGRPECLKRIAGLGFVPSLPAAEAEYVRVTA
jgi:diguanylate cyclase (GGDEF)-like protein